jgi:nitrite reductase/ring-hydroxylating ferredoxin subunit
MDNVPQGYVWACHVGDVPRRGKKTVHFDGKKVLIVACNSGIYAVEDRCPQTGRPIAHGQVLNCVLTSPTTGARYHLKTGKYLSGGLSPLQSHWLTTFPLRVIDDQVYVNVS